MLLIVRNRVPFILHLVSSGECDVVKQWQYHLLKVLHGATELLACNPLRQICQAPLPLLQLDAEQGVEKVLVSVRGR